MGERLVNDSTGPYEKENKGTTIGTSLRTSQTPLAHRADTLTSLGELTALAWTKLGVSNLFHYFLHHSEVDTAIFWSEIGWATG